MNEEPKAPAPQGSGWVRMLGLVVAFVPSALVHAVFNKNMDVNSLGFICLLAVVCCVASSIMLFRRGSTWSIVLGAMLLMLNAGITILSIIFIGCSSIKI